MTMHAALRRAITVHSVPRRILVITAAASVAGTLLAIVAGWPVWVIGLFAVLPWLPVLTSETVWTYRHYQWLALFYLLVVTQGGHVLEHLAQVIQIHALGLHGVAARGIFGALDIEWVHFVWNTWVLAAVAVLLTRFRSNRWLWATLVLAGWHEAEHIVVFVTYLTTGVAGTPGLLGRGGLIGGGLPVTRPDLHFLYNLIETTPLMIAFFVQLRVVYDEWLRRALPRVTAPVLAEATALLKVASLPRGATIVREGEPAENFYVIAQGEVAVTRAGPEGKPIDVARLGPGEYFGEIGLLREMRRTATVTAATPVELLVLDQKGFARLVADSREAHGDLDTAARDRLSRTPPAL
ncbi:MAG: cyclic nucleotide-binding domain-containing protein [Armatimonadota bacterium]